VATYSEDVTVERRNDPAAVERILRSLPEWFGIEDSLLEYVADAGTAESYLAVEDGEIVGVALVHEHFPRSAELTLIAVHAERRHGGLGSALVEAVVDSLTARGFLLLEVHTVGPSYEHDGYAATRAFYGRSEFVAMHEFHGLDWPGPTVIMVRPLRPRAAQ
jgi:GNAT superfamily N-acetyltransferase